MVHFPPLFALTNFHWDSGLPWSPEICLLYVRNRNLQERPSLATSTVHCRRYGWSTLLVFIFCRDTEVTWTEWTFWKRQLLNFYWRCQQAEWWNKNNLSRNVHLCRSLLYLLSFLSVYHLHTWLLSGSIWSLQSKRRNYTSGLLLSGCITHSKGPQRPEKSNRWQAERLFGWHWAS